jgi:hypothetical protein
VSPAGDVINSRIARAAQVYAPGMPKGEIVMNVFSKLFAALALGIAAGAVQAQSGDVGLVNMLAGDVAYQPEGSPSSKAQAFMKVRQGDRFNVPAGGQIRVVYFNGGRQETWTGPAAFRAGAQQGESSNAKPSAVSTLPGSVPQKIAQVPELIQIAKLGRSGGVAVRGGGKPPRLTTEQLAEVSGAKDTYKKMRASSTAEDITPELYLYSVLQDYLLYDDMKPIVEEMAKRQPASPEVQELVSWVKSKTN